MGGCVIRTTTRHIVQKMVIDEAKLDAVAAALGIPPAQRSQFISDTEFIHIYRGVRPTPGAPPPPPARRARASPSAGGRRQRK